MAKRLGANASNLFYHPRHARLFTSSLARQQTVRDYKAEHRDNLTVLQQEDQTLLAEAINKLDQYHEKVRNAQAFFEQTPPVVEPAPGSKILGPISVQQARVSQLTGRLDSLKDKLLNLRTHLEDLQNEPYPELGPSDADLRFKADIDKMSEKERENLLKEFSSRSNAMADRLEENFANLKQKDRRMAARTSDASIIPSVRTAYPFASSADASKAKSDEETMPASSMPNYGLGTVKSLPAKAKQFMKFGGFTNKKPKKAEEEEDKRGFGIEKDTGTKKTVWKPYTTNSPAEEQSGDNKPTEERQPSIDLQKIQAKLERSWRR